MRPHFHVAGFPVRLHPLFFLVALATGWTLISEPARLALWVGIVFVSVLLHELGHALAYRRYGCAAEIELHGMGGTTQAHDAAHLTHPQSAFVSFAGPGIGFLTGGLVWGLSQLVPLGAPGGLVDQGVRQFLWVNIGWGLFNLLPMQPLDGGHLLADLVRARGGYRHERAVLGVGIATAVGVLGLALWAKQLWIGMMALMLGMMNLEQLRRTPKEPPAEPRFAFPRGVRKTRKHQQTTAGADSIQRLMDELRETPRPPDAEDELEGPHDPALVGELLLDSGLPELAVGSLQSAFTQAPLPRTGHALVLALLRTGRLQELASLLDSSHARQLSEDTLSLISEHAGTATEATLTERITALRHGRTPATDEPR
ncbi:M50 family metallopeptidase [Myxococcus sp. SDU36]|uniref:M50 family metallopeptidase n=1 Tax=Myxococcus sp. SDU36 TaxID=2831967 RepID=UPI002542B54D|nr:M50 family metallopeptidase [Myxococcus sp. SDU36]WIG98068.1 M50 family metallopeptidase [Myxococcus sp. SDU36]